MADAWRPNGRRDLAARKSPQAEARPAAERPLFSGASTCRRRAGAVLARGDVGRLCAIIAARARSSRAEQRLISVVLVEAIGPTMSAGGVGVRWTSRTHWCLGAAGAGRRRFRYILGVYGSSRNEARSRSNDRGYLFPEIRSIPATVTHGRRFDSDRVLLLEELVPAYVEYRLRPRFIADTTHLPFIAETTWKLIITAPQARAP